MADPPIVLDIAWARPSVAEIKATGATGVVRYFSTDSTKNWTLAEFQAYTATGLEVASVWETTTNRALSDYATGQADARAADAQRAADGFPAGMPIHFAVDTDASWDQVTAYFAGVANVLTRDRTGIYGGIRVIEGAAAAGYPFRWQTDAWSSGQISPHTTLYQTGQTALGGNADINHALALDWGQYPRPETDMPLTPEDVAAVVTAVWNHNETDADNNQPVRMGAVMAWMDRIHHNQIIAIDAVKAELDTVNQKMPTGVPQLTDAQITALAAQLAPAIVPALLSAMGHALDGSKPPTA